MDKALENRLLSSGILDLLKSSGEKYAKSSDSKSLITVYEQQLYAWHDEGAAILTVDLSISERDPDECEKLLLNNPPVFEVESISMNCLGHLLALVGRKGLMVIEVPWKVGKLRTSAIERNSWFCRSWNVAERIFTCTNRVNLLQASWYPACRTSTSMMVLSSDNYLRLYDTMNLPTPLQVISLGSNVRTSFISSEFAVSLPSCLGENAVSFDFGPTEGKSFKDGSENTKAGIVCPIYVLRGNGDVYLVKLSTKKDGSRSVKVSPQPLSMYPAAEDNYGVDACVLLCLHTNPPVLVLAMASGILYHCVVLDDGYERSEELQMPWMSMESDSNPALFVHGSIQLPMFATQDDDVCSQSMRLYRDIMSSSKYHCSMVCGIHTVVVSFIKKVEDCIRKEDLEDNITEVLENDCVVEHLLCTQPTASTSPVPVIGLAPTIQNSGLILISLLASWEFQCLPLLSSFQSYAPALLSSESSPTARNDKSSDCQESFETHIQNLLLRSTGAPILKLNDSGEPSSKQHLDLVCSTIQHLREEYIRKFLAVQAQIDSRTKVLMQNKNEQMAQLQRLIQNKEKLHNNVENLAKKYNDTCTKQQRLFERIEAILKRSEQRFPSLSSAETNMKMELGHIDNKMKDLKESLDQLKKKEKLRDQKAKEFENMKSTEGLTRQLSKMCIGDTQVRHVMEILREEGISIGKLTRSISNLKKELMLT